MDITGNIVTNYIIVMKIIYIMGFWHYMAK